MTIGIYRLSWDIEGKIFSYIGQSVNVETRTKTHLRKLATNSHTNKLMQEVYNAIGEPVVELLAEIPEYELNAAEAYYIDLYDSYFNGLNQTKGGGTRGGGPMGPWSPIDPYAPILNRHTRKPMETTLVDYIFNKWVFSFLVVFIYVIVTGGK